MARKTTVSLSDDLDGGKAVETVKFGLEGRNYEIDLNKRNAAALRKALAEFMKGARPVRSVKPAVKAPARPPARVDAKAVREWAQGAGLHVSARGRVPSELVEKYLAAVG